MTGGKAPELVPSARFVLRTPLLPFQEFTSWAERFEAAAMEGEAGLEEALGRDCDALRRRLEEILGRPEVREAVFVASPDLQQSFHHWRENPDGPRGLKVERALVRYFSRMAGRATPFGLFSGVSVGRVGAATRLEVAERSSYRRHTRLDNDYLFALTTELGRDPAVRSELRYVPNSSLYRAAGRIRYAEARLDGKERTYHLVAAEPTEYLERTLDRARSGARVGDLARALVEDDPEIELEEALEFVGELVDSELLVSALSPPVTGDEPIHGVLRVLEGLEAESARRAAEGLSTAQRAIEAIDAAGPGVAGERYLEVARELSKLPVSVELSRLFQVDMVKPSPEATLGDAVVGEIQRGVGILQRMTPRRQSEDTISRFREAFMARYETREVPLVEVLDEEAGIGFESAGAPSAEPSPLLDGLAFPGSGGPSQVSWGRRESYLARRVQELAARGETRLELGKKELEKLEVEEPAPLPDAFSVMPTLAARSDGELEKGRFQLLLEHAGGPSGARLLGRFCHASGDVHREVSEHLRAEEALHPEAVFAEIAHLPQGRIGNILFRPVLRDYEIPYLGLSGAPPDQQIPVQDLMVSVTDGRVVLRSRRLGREVIPRLTTAHNFRLRSLPIYRFLCALQGQTARGVAWTWGALDALPFLPRVTCGRLVLSRARWLLSREELEPIEEAARGAKKAKDRSASLALRARVFRAVQELRARRQLPRFAVLADADNELPLDFDNPLSVDSFAHLVKSRPSAVICEQFPAEEELVARGPEGRFVEELVLGFTRQREPSRPPEIREARAPRRFAPGSEWLYAKIFTGTATADELLRSVVAPVVRQMLGSGAIDRWFFLRFGDPAWHLRVRFHGDPARLRAEVQPALEAACAPLLEEGYLWRLQYDTYEREVERYGGDEGIALAERAFWVDSEAVLEVVELLEGDAGADARWRLALRGADMLLQDLGLDLEERYEVMKRARWSFGREFNEDVNLQKQIGDKFRKERKALEALLDPQNDAGSDLEPGFDALERRSRALAPIAEELSRLDASGRLHPGIQDFSWSWVHMHVNRLLRSAQRANELVLYDFLKRLYESRLARERKKRTG